MKQRFLLLGISNFILCLLFMHLLIQSLQVSGWSLLTFLIALIATHDFVQGFRLIMAYFSIRDK